MTFNIVQPVYAEDDTDPPVIIGMTDRDVEYGSVLDVQDGVSATDNVDGTVNVTADPATIDTTVEGPVTVVYSATDAAGNTATESAIITVMAQADKEPPVISGVLDQDIEYGSEVDVLAGVSATDNVDKNVAVSAEPSALDTTIPGEYKVTYTATDAAGNIAEAAAVFTIMPAPVSGKVSMLISATTGDLTITVSGVSSLDADGATIQLVSAGNTHVYYGQTGSDGSITFTDLPPGTYYASAMYTKNSTVYKGQLGGSSSAPTYPITVTAGQTATANIPLSSSSKYDHIDLRLNGSYVVTYLDSSAQTHTITVDTTVLGSASIAVGGTSYSLTSYNGTENEFRKTGLSLPNDLIPYNDFTIACMIELDHATISGNPYLSAIFANLLQTSGTYSGKYVLNVNDYHPLANICVYGSGTNYNRASGYDFEVDLQKLLDLVDVKVDKIWSGGTGDPVTVRLLANGSVYNIGTSDVIEGVQVLNQGNSWSYTWGNLLKYDSNGRITYTVEEVNTPAGYLSSSTYADDDDGDRIYTITNTLNCTAEISGTKVWVDNSNSYGTRPTTLTVTLYRNGTAFQTKNLTITSSSNSFAFSFTGLVKYDPSGTLYTYTVGEKDADVPAGYVRTQTGTTITNTLSCTIAISGSKVWIDNGNAYNTRPSTLTITLYRNGTVFQTKDLTITSSPNSFAFSFTGLAKYDAGGLLYTYTVGEASVPANYVKSQVENTITNTLTGTTEISGSKVWVDNGNAYNTRPSTLPITLYQNGTAIQTKSLAITSSPNSFSFSFTGLAKYDAAGALYTYTVGEKDVDVPGGYVRTQVGNTITNTLSSTTEISGTKVWADNSNAYGTRPGTLTITLYRNGSAVDTKNLTITSSSNSFAFSFTGLAKYDTAGALYTYTIGEATVPANYVKTQVGNTITNTLTGTTEISGSKVWVDNSNAYQTRPGTLTITLYRNGSAVDTRILTITSSSNSFVFSFTGLAKYDASGTLYTYTVGEATVPANYVKTQAGNTITNTLTGDTSISGSKVWVDNSNAYGTRPTALTVTLYQNGAVFQTKSLTITSSSNSFAFSFTGLAKYDASGILYTYTVGEKDADVPANYVRTQDGNTITNTLTGTTEISGSKVWVDNSNAYGTRPTALTVTLYQNGAVFQTKSLTITSSSNSFAFSFTGLVKYDASGTLYTYTVGEATVPANYAKTQVGNTITNTLTGETSISGSKVWVDNSNAYGTRPTALTVTLYQNGTAIQTKSLAITSSPDSFVFSFTGLAKYDAAGVLYTYTVGEKDADVPANYVRTQVGNTITNTLTGETSISGSKVWSDNSNAYGTRPTALTVTLYQNGAAFQTKNLTITSSPDSFAFSFTGLAKYDRFGALFVYTVGEKDVDVPGGYIRTQVGNTITNTLTGTTEISGSKVWVDNSNAYATRPAALTVTLYRNGSAVDTKSLAITTSPDSFVFSFTGLAKYNAAGVLYTYTVGEKDADVPGGYVRTQVGNTITNTLTGETSISGSKVWSDNSNAYGTRPAALTVTLYQNGAAFQTKNLTITSSPDSFAFSFTGLAKYDRFGALFVYTVGEKDADVPANYVRTQVGNTITNTLTGDTSISGTKVWVDNSNAYATRPTALTVTLYRNGSAVDTKSLTITSSSNSFAFSFTGLAKYDAAGALYTYTVGEKDADVPTNYIRTQVGNTITNTLTGTTEISGSKVWVDNSNAYSTRPAALTVTLYQNGTAFQTKSLTITSSSNSFAFSFTGLAKYDAAGALYTYTVGEKDADVPANYVRTQVGNTITNTLTGETSISGTKVWVDNSNTYGTRPTALTVTLYRNGSAVDTKSLTITSSSNSFAFSFTGLAKYDAAGALYTYTVGEATVPANYAKTQVGNTITNTLTGETSISGSKVWVDNSNIYNTRPTALTVTLYRNGSAVDTKSLTITSSSDSFAFSFTGLAKYDAAGELYTYTVGEATVPANYAKTQVGNTITNTLTGETSISGSKVWADNSNAYGTRPAALTVTLYQNGAAFQTKSLTITSSPDSFAFSFTGLAKYDAVGALYTYTVGEKDTDVPANYVRTQVGNTITNTLTGTTEISGSKVWVDNSNAYATRPTALTVTLYQNGTAIQTKSLAITSSPDSFAFSFTGLAKYDATGTLYTYTVGEKDADVPANYVRTQVGNTITNTLTGETSISGTKVWVDNSNAYGTRPAALTVTLYQNGTAFQTRSLTITTSPDSFAFSFTGLAKYDRFGALFTYTIGEKDADVPANYVRTQVGNTITNTLTGETSISGSKVWLDNSNAYDTRPATLTVTLYRNGTAFQTKDLTITTSPDSFAFSFTSLAKYDAAGVLYTYTIGEKDADVPGGYVRTQAGNTITNTLTGETSISGTKVWADNSNAYDTRPATLTVTLYRNGTAFQTKDLTITSSDDSFAFSFTDLAKYDVSGVLYTYTVGEKDVDVPANYVRTQVDNTITNTLTGETSISGTKVWVDNSNVYGTRPTALTVTLYQNGTAFQTKELTITASSNSFAFSFTGLAKYDKYGVLFAYTVGEKDADVPGGYVRTQDGGTITNTLDTTDITVKKIWNDMNNAAGIRPASITVELLQNGKSFEPSMTFVLDANNSWSHIFTGLPRADAKGVAYIYTVKEITAVSGYTTTYSEDTLTITNTHYYYFNPQYPIVITKLDGSTGLALAGATFQVYRQINGVQIAVGSAFTSNTSGIATSELFDPGDYFVKETSAPAGYILDTVFHAVTVSAQTGTATITLSNTRTPYPIVISKIDSATGLALAGAKFQIYKDVGGVKVAVGAELTSNVSGVATSQSLEPGEYFVKETGAPDGYALDAIYHAVTIAIGQTNAMVMITLTNSAVLGAARSPSATPTATPAAKGVLAARTGEASNAANSTIAIALLLSAAVLLFIGFRRRHDDVSDDEKPDNTHFDAD